MLVDLDAKALEWVAAVFLSQDEVGMKELWDDEDQHGLNQTYLTLPSRLVAKKFLFRMIFGGTNYANDAEFFEVSRKEEFWQEIIAKFYRKYKGLQAWHDKLVEHVALKGWTQIPTGRVFTYPKQRVLDRPAILNYPVQGLGAEIMSLARVVLWNYLRDRYSNQEVVWICTVHDSILWDVNDQKVSIPEFGKDLKEGWNTIPDEFEKRFGVEFNVPLRCEVKVGKDWKNQTEA